MAAGRTVLYIDNSNIFRGCKKSGWRPSYKRIREFLEHEEGPIQGVHFFASEQVVPREKQGRFYSALKNELGFQIHTYQLAHRKVKCAHCGHLEWVPAEKGVDVGLVTQLFKDFINHAFDTALIMSSDLDFLDALLKVKSAGREVKVIAWRWTLPEEMVRVCRERDLPILCLEEHKEHFRKPEGDIL